MLTVKEFEGLGVEMLCSDKVQWRHGNQVGVISFAWRPLSTLPDNPKFKYEKSKFNSFWRPLLEQSVDNNLTYSPEKFPGIKPVFTQEMAEPSIGFKLKFNHDIDGKFSRLHDEKYGWEDGDDLEVIHITVNNDEEVCYIVLNCQPDVLNTAVITDLSFFDTRTPKQKAVDEAMADIDADVDDVANVIGVIERMIAAGYKKC